VPTHPDDETLGTGTEWMASDSANSLLNTKTPEVASSGVWIEKRDLTDLMSVVMLTRDKIRKKLVVLVAN